MHIGTQSVVTNYHSTKLIWFDNLVASADLGFQGKLKTGWENISTGFDVLVTTAGIPMSADFPRSEQRKWTKACRSHPLQRKHRQWLQYPRPVSSIPELKRGDGPADLLWRYWNSIVWYSEQNWREKYNSNSGRGPTHLMFGSCGIDAKKLTTVKKSQSN